MKLNFDKMIKLLFGELNKKKKRVQMALQLNRNSIQIIIIL